MNNRGGDGTSCFKIEIRTDAMKLTNERMTDLDSAEIWSERVRCSSKTKPKPRLRVESAVLREVFCILVSCCLLPMRRNSVLDELRVNDA